MRGTCAGDDPYEFTVLQRYTAVDICRFYLLIERPATRARILTLAHGARRCRARPVSGRRVHTVIIIVINNGVTRYRWLIDGACKL